MITGTLTVGTTSVNMSSVIFNWLPPDEPPPAAVPARPVPRPDAPPTLVARRAPDGAWAVPAALAAAR